MTYQVQVRAPGTDWQPTDTTTDDVVHAWEAVFEMRRNNPDRQYRAAKVEP